jgi:hypothetical protein
MSPFVQVVEKQLVNYSKIFCLLLCSLLFSGCEASTPESFKSSQKITLWAFDITGSMKQKALTSATKLIRQDISVALEPWSEIEANELAEAPSVESYVDWTWIQSNAARAELNQVFSKSHAETIYQIIKDSNIKAEGEIYNFKAIGGRGGLWEMGILNNWTKDQCVSEFKKPYTEGGFTGKALNSPPGIEKLTNVCSVINEVNSEIVRIEQKVNEVDSIDGTDIRGFFETIGSSYAKEIKDNPGIVLEIKSISDLENWQDDPRYQLKRQLSSLDIDQTCDLAKNWSGEKYSYSSNLILTNFGLGATINEESPLDYEKGKKFWTCFIQEKFGSSEIYFESLTKISEE